MYDVKVLKSGADFEICHVTNFATLNNSSVEICSC